MNLTLPEQIDRLLSKLRSAIRRYVILRGTAVVLTTLIAIFWTMLVLDVAWFSSTRLELPRAVRLTILIGSVVLIAAVLFRMIFWQLMIQLKQSALALILEKRFPELNDRLITAVESSQEIEQNNPPSKPPELTQAMLSRTVNEASQLTETLNVKEVFNSTPIKRSIAIAFLAIVSVTATAVASPQTFSHWSKAYLRLADEYWERVNGLDVYLIAQPGDRIRKFKNGVSKHAAGADLTIMVETQPNKITPSQVLLKYKTSTGARGQAMMSPAGKNKFRHTIGNLVDDLEFTLTGGDFTTVRPYRVVTVPEPRLESLQAECRYPDYTGWNNPGVGEEKEIRISSSEVSVPMETELILRTKTTKPVVEVKITGRNFELELKKEAESGHSSALCKFIDERGLIVKQIHVARENFEFIDQTGSHVSIPFFVTSRDPISADSKEELFPYIPINREESLRIYLEDRDGIINLEPARLRLIGIEDSPPEVQTQLAGIGKAITRKAFLPFAGEAKDDYGLGELYFEYRINQDKETQKLPLSRQPNGNSFYLMDGSAETPKEKFDVLPLELNLNDILYVNLAAVDQDLLNGPHPSKGETYRMKVVSDEELLSILHQDELNLRKRFEQIIDELTRSRDDLDETNNRSESSPENKEANRQLVAEAIQRSLNIVRKDRIETDAIRVAFEDIHQELVNNRIETPQIRRRLVDNIIEPLGKILTEEFSTTEERLRLVDFSFRDHSSAEYTSGQCVEEMDRLLTSLRQVLLEMRKLEDFQEVIELLKGIIEDERALREKTEAERKKKLIDLLN